MSAPIRFLLFLPALVAGCNATMKGESAPALRPAAWIVPDGRTRPSMEGKHVWVEFFSPT